MSFMNNIMTTMYGMCGVGADNILKEQYTVYFFYRELFKLLRTTSFWNLRRIYQLIICTATYSDLTRVCL